MSRVMLRGCSGWQMEHAQGKQNRVLCCLEIVTCSANEFTLSSVPVSLLARLPNPGVLLRLVQPHPQFALLTPAIKGISFTFSRYVLEVLVAVPCYLLNWESEN